MASGMYAAQLQTVDAQTKAACATRPCTRTQPSQGPHRLRGGRAGEAEERERERRRLTRPPPELLLPLLPDAEALRRLADRTALL